jgi:hypothetical protein
MNVRGLLYPYSFYIVKFYVETVTIDTKMYPYYTKKREDL